MLGEARFMPLLSREAVNLSHAGAFLDGRVTGEEYP